MQAGRRKGSAATESEARQSGGDARAPTPSRSQSATRRSGSQPKQRGASTNATAATTANRSNSNARSASTGRGASSAPSASPGEGKPVVPMQTPFEVALARMKKAAAGKTEEQLELLLQQLLQQRQFEDAAYLIAASPALEAKYKTADVIRLLLDVKQFDKAAQLIRDMKLHSNQLLVTLFIKELVRASLFQAAVRYAQEMVQNFGKNDFGPRDQARPSWTPQALIQAMIRAQQFRSALKYAKQFGLLELFPPTQLIASMFEVRSWDEAVSSVLEFRLFQDFPLDLLVPKLLENRQWSNAVKCINKLPTQEMIDRAYEALVREAARVGDFVTSLRYLREFKLDQPDTNGPLLKYFVDCMIAHGEFYKAIKYSIKFGMNLPPPDAEETGEISIYDTEVLIRKAIEAGQYHVALLYIKKLKLKEKFSKELEMIQQLQERMLQEFHQFMAARSMQFQHPHIQREMAAILGPLGVDEMVDQIIETEVVISQEEEIIPRKTRKPTEDALSGEPLITDEPLQHLAGKIETPSSVNAASDPFAEAPRRSSRFSFARADSDIAATGQSVSTQILPPQQQQPLAQKPIARAPPPGLAPPTAVQTGPTAEDASTSSFNFAQFAATLQNGQNGQVKMPARPPPSTPSPQPPQPPQGLSHLFPHQTQSHPSAQRPGGFYPPPPPPPQFGGVPNQHGFSGPPPAHQQPPMPMYYQSSQPGFSQPPPQPNGSMPPPPPMPPQYVASSSGGSSNGSFDISSLAMQFHARPQAPGFGNAGFNQFGQGGPPPPPMPPGMPGGLFPSMGPPMQGFPPPPQPQFSFKPSVSYTSVSTMRQKK